MDFDKHLKTYLTDEEINDLNSSILEENLKAVLLNTEKMDSPTFLSLYPNCTPHPIVKNAFIYNPKEYQLGKSIYHDLGCFYIQEPSSMLPAFILNANEDDVVLDLCAAPGGKSVQTSFNMHNKGLIVSNDLSYQRATTIIDNAERLGLGNILVTNNDFSKISHKFQNYFTKIILDAPCSGSGMFKKSDKMKDDWSYNKVEKFASIQKELILMCYDMLKPGGEMIYSTCSFSYEEDEDVILHLLNNRDATLSDIQDNELYYKNRINGVGIHLLPNIFPGDGHYFCLVKKPGNLTKITANSANSKTKVLYLDFINNRNNIVHNNVHYSLNNIDIKHSNLNILRFGIKLGEYKGKDFIYDYHLSHYLKDFINEIELDENDANAYLKGNVLSMNKSNGTYLIKYQNIPISFGKVVNGMIKNHYPKYLRK